MMKFALATANKGKITEICEILSEHNIKAVTRDELGINVEIEETGFSFYENALIKAKVICKLSGLPSIADDSGICIDALDGAPGIFASSFGGENLTDSERNEYLLSLLDDVEHRGAKFVCNIVCVFPNDDVINAVGECKGEILRTPIGTNGFGYDPVFRAEGQTKSMAELPTQVKNDISHRGRALKAFAAKLNDYVKKREY